jgi:hypothetical protein
MTLGRAIGLAAIPSSFTDTEIPNMIRPLIRQASFGAFTVAVSLAVLLPLTLVAPASSAPRSSVPIIEPTPGPAPADPCSREQIKLRTPPYASPASLKATEVAAHTIDLTWPRVDGVSYYRLFGSTLPAAGVVTIGQTFRLLDVPTGSQMYSISSEYPCVSNTSGLPRVEVAVQPFFGVIASTYRQGAGGGVRIDFDVATLEPLTFRLWRDDGRGGAETEVTAGVTWTRGATSQPSITHVTGSISTQGLSPIVTYKFRMAADFGNGSFVPSGFLPVSIPEFLVRATVPLAADRVVIEWNPFGSAPYQVRKGTMLVQPTTGSSIPMDFVRDTAGNPLNFTGYRFEDFIVQHGVTYFYEVCAPIGAPYTKGYACPNVAVMIP